VLRIPPLIDRDVLDTARTRAVVMSTLRAPDPPLSDDHVALRPLAEEHVPVVERALADLEIQRWFDDRGLTARDVVARAAARSGRNEAAEFAIIDKAECVGSIWLNLGLDGRAGVGYWLLAHARGKGLATSALLLVARWAFDALGVKRIGLNADPRNVASVRVAERVGFTREGLLRSWADVNGERVDQLSFSLLPSDLTAVSAGESRE
jgi:RimJ/RimL family protein N-acetyltransferase